MDEPNKVVSLRGDPVCLPGEPRPNLIEALESALEMARSGEIVGMAVAFVHADKATSTMRFGSLTRSLIGELEMLKSRLVEQRRKMDEME